MATRLASLLGALFVVACSESTPLTPSAHTLIVHAVLDPSARHQLVVVQTTSGAIEAEKQVLGATVTITTPDGRTLTGIERRDTTAVTACCAFSVTTIYDVDVGTEGLIPGGTYSLRVKEPNGRTVTGKTTIPNAIPTTTAVAPLTIDRLRDTIRLQWSRVPGARAYQVFVRSKADSYNIFADTSIVLPGTAEDIDGSPVAFTSGLTHQLAVVAVDQNYYDYYRRSADVFTGGGLSLHLEGGVGLFGSVVTVAVRTINVR